MHREMLRAGVLLLARTCLYQAVPERPEAELSCRSRGGCSAETAIPSEHLSGSAGELSSAEGITAGGGLCHRPGSALGASGLERSGLELLALGAKARELPRAFPRWSQGSVFRSELDKEIHKSRPQAPGVSLLSSDSVS